MNRCYSVPVALASLCGVLLAGCEGGPRWIGLIAGDPWGLCYRQEIMSSNESISVGLDLDNVGNDIIHLHADWIRYEPGWQADEFFFYWGLGLDVASWSDHLPPFADQRDNAYVALRVPLGLEWEIPSVRDWILFLQIVPKIPFGQRDAHLDAAFGLIFGF